MTITLFPHQERGAAFLAESPGTKGLFFGMGTGKTLTAIYAARRTGFARAVVVGPPISLPMWVDECEEHMKALPGGAPRDAKVQLLKTGKTPIEQGADVLVVSWTIATTRAAELRDWLAADPLGEGILILDEAHALKSVKAKRTKAIYGKDGLADGAAYVWALTGTPITRWNDDMFPFLCRADLQGLKDMCGGVAQEKFLLRYTIRQKRQFPGARWPVEMVIGNRNTEELADWVYGNDGGEVLAMRVDLKEVFENMPPLTHRRYTVDLDTKAMGTEMVAAMKDLEKRSIADIRKGLQSKEPALATVRRAMGMGMVKAAVAEISERIESGQNVLVGAWHTDVIDALVAALNSKGYSLGVIDGRGTSVNKQSVQDDWNAGKLNAVVAQIAAAGVSLNLQHGGTQIIVVEEDWSPSIMDQFYARLWRYGQEQHVHVDTLTTDRKLSKALGRISGTKAREHEKFNAVGRAMQDAAPQQEDAAG